MLARPALSPVTSHLILSTAPGDDRFHFTDEETEVPAGARLDRARTGREWPGWDENAGLRGSRVAPTIVTASVPPKGGGIPGPKLRKPHRPQGARMAPCHCHCLQTTPRSLKSVCLQGGPSSRPCLGV